MIGSLKVPKSKHRVSSAPNDNGILYRVETIEWERKIRLCDWIGVIGHGCKDVPLIGSAANRKQALVRKLIFHGEMND